MKYGLCKRILSCLLTGAITFSAADIPSYATEDIAVVDETPDNNGKELTDEKEAEPETPDPDTDESIQVPDVEGSDSDTTDVISDESNSDTPIEISEEQDKNLLASSDESTTSTTINSGTIDNINWTLDDTGVLTITGEGEINNTFNGSVNDIRDKVKTVHLAEGIAIGDFAFFSFSALESIEIPEGVTSIGSTAFSGCVSLKKIVLPESLTDIEYEIFDDCTLIKTAGPTGGDYDVQFGWKTSIPDNGLRFPNLEEVTFPEDLTIIGGQAFYKCSSLTHVELPENLQRISYSAFEECDNLEYVYIPRNVTQIEASAFKGCPKLVTAGPKGGRYNIEFGWDEVIQSGAFAGAGSLQSVVIPEGIVEIGSSAFIACSSLTDVTIPSSVTEIKTATFKDCTSLIEISIPQSVTSLGYLAFSGCTSLKKISLPDTLEYIDSEAFKDCTGLEEIKLPQSLTGIGDSTFSGCTALTSVTIPFTVTNIGGYAFYNCPNLTTVNYGSTKEKWDTIKIGVYNQNLTEAQINFKSTLGDGVCTDTISWQLEPNGILRVYGTGRLPDYKWNEAPWYPIRNDVKAILVDQGITYIGSYAFYDCVGATSLEIPQSVTEIHKDAFNGIYNITDIYYTDSASQWKSLIQNVNNKLSNATIHYMVRVIYDNVGGTMPSTGKYAYKGQPYGYLPTPQKPDCVFEGWYLSEDYKPADKVTDTTIVKTDKTHTLYAHWLTDRYHVTFEAYEGNILTDDAKDVKYGTKYGTLPTPPARPGFTFTGWYLSTQDNEPITADSIVTLTRDHTLYGGWAVAEPEGLFLDHDSLRLTIGETKAIIARISPADPANTITWSSSDPAVVTVNKGTLKALSAGKAVINAETADGNLTASCEVTVIASDAINNESLSEDFTIPDGLWTTGIEESYPYTGAKITPVPKVYFGNTQLRSGSEYTVFYKNNVKAGTATLTITGRGNYTGRCTKTFEITPLTIEADDIDIVVGIENNNKAVKPTVIVSHNGISLREKRDYLLSYEPIYAAGSTTVTVTGTGNYEGTVDKEFIVRAKGAASLKSATLGGLQKSYTLPEIQSLMGDYSSLKVKLGKNEISCDDYTLRFENCNKVGKGTIVIQPTETGTYVGEKRISVTIAGTRLGSLIISPGFTYNGAVREPEVCVYTGAKGKGDLIPADCYDVTYNVSPVNAGTVTVTVAAKADMGYSGKLTKKYKISPCSINDEGVTVSFPEEVSYVQGGAKPAPVVYYTNGETTWTLREGFDYTVSYANFGAANGSKTPTFTITGRGNFTGKRAPQTYTITRKNIGDLAISCVDIAANAKKKGSYYYSKPVIYDVNGKTLRENTDYTVSYTYLIGNKPVGKQDVIKAGTAMVATIIAKDKNYTGTATVVYHVVDTAKNLNSAKLTKAIGNKQYTGKAIKLTEGELDSLGLTFTTGSGRNRVIDTLTEGEDYVITAYYNNVNKGTASLRLEGHGEYTGIKILTFRIVAVSALTSWLGTYNTGRLVGTTATTITLAPDTLSLTKGDKAVLTPTYGPANCDIPEVTWKSSNTRVATVDKYGNVTARNKGTTVITVTSNANKSAKGSVTVTVE